MATIIDGKKTAADIHSEIKLEIDRLIVEGQQVPGLAVILVGDDPASEVYVASKGRACKKLGMHSVTEKLSANASENKVIELVNEFNNDPSIHGILVQLPLPGHINSDHVVESISPLKDVDGLHPFNIGLLASGKPRFIPCTPYGILQLLKRYSVSTEGKEVVVLGRSNLVGRPISNLLSLKTDYGNATVTTCHSRSRNIADICRRADILIVAIGQKKYVTRNMVKPGAVVIDVGIHRLNDEEGGGLCGDVNYEQVSDIASAITPVPGGVGPMTIAMLMANTLQSRNSYCLK
jgi:methylenetetrahydrofolate dehydrogenase (NADP+) / methenyltetrahydrofolate cyclohydrolase